MSDREIKQVSDLTGTFRAAKQLTDDAKSGSRKISAGKKLPVDEQIDMKQLAEKLNIASQDIGRDLRFDVDMESGRSVIQVLDRETGEIIRQIPPEKAKTYVSESGDVALRLFDDQV